MGDVVLYTAVFGGRDVVPARPAPLPPSIDFVCFTDDSAAAGRPGVVYTPALAPRDPVRSARLLKCMPQLFLPGRTHWIWADASFVLKEGADLQEMLRLSGPIGSMRHRQRECPYEEAEICASFGNDDPPTIARQVKRYRQAGYPEKSGLTETGLLARENDPRVLAFNALWWAEVSNYSKRDQISFDFCAREAGLRVTHLGTVDDNPWFSYVGHTG